MTVLYPIAYPVSKILDYLFGTEEESPNIPREELGALMRLQSAEEPEGDGHRHLAGDVQFANERGSNRATPSGSEEGLARHTSSSLSRKEVCAPFLYVTS